MKERYRKSQFPDTGAYRDEISIVGCPVKNPERNYEQKKKKNRCYRAQIRRVNHICAQSTSDTDLKSLHLRFKYPKCNNRYKDNMLFICYIALAAAHLLLHEILDRADEPLICFLENPHSQYCCQIRSWPSFSFVLESQGYSKGEDRSLR